MCCVYNEKFWNLHELHELREGEDLDESVDLLLCDPSYNIYRQHDFRNIEHDVFNAKNIGVFQDFSE